METDISEHKVVCLAFWYKKVVLRDGSELELLVLGLVVDDLQEQEFNPYEKNYEFDEVNYDDEL